MDVHGNLWFDQNYSSASNRIKEKNSMILQNWSCSRKTWKVAIESRKVFPLGLVQLCKPNYTLLKKLTFRSAIKILCMYHKVDINGPLERCECSNWRTERNSNFGLQSYYWKCVKANDVTFTVRSFKIHISNALLICSTFMSLKTRTDKIDIICQ